MKEQDSKSLSQWIIAECDQRVLKTHLLRTQISSNNKIYDIIYIFSPVGKIHHSYLFSSSLFL